MESWQGLFLEREQELHTLHELWAQAKSGRPQLAVITAHPGLGKTRLVQEFYHQVSTTDDGAGAAGYWPDRLSRERDALRLSPQPTECLDENGIPYLWWGFKLVDQGSNDSGTSGLHEATDLYLYPHLAAMRRAAQLRALSVQRSEELSGGVKDVARMGAEAGIGLIPIIGPALVTLAAVAEKAKKRYQSVRALDEQQSTLAVPVSAGEESNRCAVAFEDEILRSLRDYIDSGRGGDGRSRHPVIIVIDDAQFSNEDAAANSLIQRLLDHAWAEDWPLLMLMTYWPDRWSADAANKNGIPFAVHSKAAESASPSSSHFNRGTPFAWTEIELTSLISLDELVKRALPGLPDEQKAQLESRAYGNPRYIERLLQLLINSPALFIGRSIDNALTPDALYSILDEKFDLHQVTLRLIQSADLCAQQALALSAMIGARFRCQLIVDLGSALSLEEIQQGLYRSERPLHILSGVDTGVAEFQQGVFQSVASSLVSRVIGPTDQIEQFLEQQYRRLLDNWDLDLRDIAESEQMLKNLLNRYQAKTSTSSQFILLGRATLRLLDIATERHDLVSANAIFEQWNRGTDDALWSKHAFNTYERSAIIFYHCLREDYETAESVLVEQRRKGNARFIDGASDVMSLFHASEQNGQCT